MNKEIECRKKHLYDLIQGIDAQVKILRELIRKLEDEGTRLRQKYEDLCEGKG